MCASGCVFDYALRRYNEKGDPENDPELGYVIVPLQEVFCAGVFVMSENAPNVRYTF